MDLKETIRSIKDFPEKGIIFRDITTLLKNGEALRQAVDEMDAALSDVDYDVVVAPESRGFIFGMPIAYNKCKGFVPIRKKGKLPAETVSQEYELEYGTATIEMHIDALKKGQKVVILDDLLATGGTAKAMIKLIESVGAEVVGLCFLIELEALEGKRFLEGYNVKTILKY